MGKDKINNWLLLGKEAYYDGQQIPEPSKSGSKADWMRKAYNQELLLVAAIADECQQVTKGLDV